MNIESNFTHYNRASVNNQRYEFDPDNPFKINNAILRNKNLYKEKYNYFCN